MFIRRSVFTALASSTSSRRPAALLMVLLFALASTPAPAATAPGAPTGVSAVAGNTIATVSWTAPASNGGSAISSYTITASPGGALMHVGGTASSGTVFGLANGTSYTFTVSATNVVGTGPASVASAAVTPLSTPGAPTGVSAVAGNASATVSWTAPASNGGSAITGYLVGSTPGGITVNAGATASSATFTGLINGVAYTFNVRATNAQGIGAFSANSAAVTPMAVPGAPRNVVATRGNGSATVSWTAPSGNGSAITSYTVTTYAAGVAIVGSPLSAGSTSTVVTGLTNGSSYTFTVYATNGLGSGAASAATAAVTPAGTPGSPSGVSAVAGNTIATVHWTAPASNGGSAITQYTVTASPGGAVAYVGSAASSGTVYGLSNGTSYTFTVTATNVVGTGPASAASAAVTPLSTPGAPTGVSAVAGNASATVSWTAPASNGGSAITGYIVGSSPGGVTVNAGATAGSAMVAGLVNGTAYTFTVRATNAQGTGAFSAASAAVTPTAAATVPGAPTGVVAMAGNASATVSWAAPASNGGSVITNYTVHASPGGATVNAAGTAATLTGLTNGTSYTFTVTASNAVGTGPASAASAPVTPTAAATAPGAPTGVVAIAGNASATVSWTAPANNGGSAVTGYTVTASPGGSTATATATTATIPGLTNGTSYTFTVTARNAVGTGPASAASAAVTPTATTTAPGAPTGVSAVAGNTIATVHWTAPASNGGSAITQYTVTASPGGAVAYVGGAAGSGTVYGLSNGTSYTFTVTATNVVGTGPASAASAAVTPLSTPGAPTGVSAVAGNASATVSWTAPASNGGSAITGYIVGSTPDGIVVNAGATASSATFTGLTNGVAYTFNVRATNAQGIGAFSANSAAVTPTAAVTVPGAPTGVVATAGNASALVNWTAPASNGGSAITGYTVKANTGATASPVGAATSLTFPSLTNGTPYTFTVAARNAAGTGAFSAASAPVTPVASAVTITISPRSAAITISQPQQFTATVTGTTITGVTWNVDGVIGGNASVGTVSLTGLYMPPSAGGAHIITATSQADISKVATATVGVTDLAGVFTYHNDIARTGQNLQEYALTPANVASSFGKLFSCPVDGVVYAQPLYVANLNVTGFGVHNVVFVVTMKDSLYAFDADNPACVTYWYQNFLPVGAVPVPVTDATSAGDVPGTFGIMGTPVIGNSNIYFVDRYKTTATTTYTEQLHAVNIATGLEIAGSPVSVAPSVSGNSSGGATVTFNPLTQAQRPALLLLGTNVYAAFGSAGDNGNYNGWLVGYDTASLAQTAVFNSVPNGGAVAQGGQGAFWMCGGGPASDGTSIYVATANGLFDNTANAVPPVAPLNDMGDSLLKLSPSLAIQDFFTPFDQATDYTTDLDFGSGGVIVLPNSMGGASHPHLVIATGKPGKLYMDDRDAMARYQRGNGGTDANVQTVPVATAANTGLWATPAIWGSNLYIAGYSATLKAFPVINGTIGAFSAQSADAFQGGGATPSVSAMGTGQTAANNAIVWTLDNSNNGATFGFSYGPAILRAYDATNVATRLYASSTLAADAAGNAVKFTVPTVANGKVYVAGGQAGSSVGTTGQLTVYGLKP